MTKCGKMEFRMHGFDAPPPPNPPGGLPEKKPPYGYFCKGSKFRKIHIQMYSGESVHAIEHQIKSGHIYMI
jgi:hypothetical protein